MTLKEMINEVKKQYGYDVDIEHFREWPDTASPENLEALAKNGSMAPSPKGGATQAILHNNGEVFLVGKALCSNEDNYSRHLGALIALGRAKAYLEEINNEKKVRMIGNGFVIDFKKQ